MARNAFALVLLLGLGLGGCSKLPTKLTSKLPFLGSKQPKETEVNMAALRARTDSLRKARHVTDSLIQVRFTACADSVRTDMTKVLMKAKKKRKKQANTPAEDLIGAQVQMACSHDLSVPPTTVATTPAAPAKADSVKTPAPAAKPTSAKPMQLPGAATSAPAAPAPAAPAPAVVAATKPDTASAPVQDAAWADSVRKAKEMEMSRETFAYSGAPRDPFNSLLNMAKSGPEVADLQLVGIYQNLRTPSASVAVFREKGDGKRHKLRAGDQVGRSRVMQIRDRDVVFVIEDFGFERQDTLSLRKQEDVTP